MSLKYLPSKQYDISRQTVEHPPMPYVNVVNELAIEVHDEAKGNYNKSSEPASPGPILRNEGLRQENSHKCIILLGFPIVHRSIVSACLG